MTHRIVVNVQTGEITQVDLTAEEVTQAQASHAAWVIAEAQRQLTPTLEETIQTQADTITALTARLEALESRT
jgi:tRNA C32,U32 (ribose-2'-O)-methylase TrmJ